MSLLADVVPPPKRGAPDHLPLKWREGHVMHMENAEGLTMPACDTYNLYAGARPHA